jgi:hypothetical protein
MLQRLDFLVRFWELRARHAAGGEPLTTGDQVELLSLMQLMTADLAIPKAGPVRSHADVVPVQLIGDGGIVAAELRKVTAAGLIAVSSSAIAPGAQMVVRVSDAILGTEFSIPCAVAWCHRAANYTVALAVDGIPTRAGIAFVPRLPTQYSFRPRERMAG